MAIMRGKQALVDMNKSRFSSPDKMGQICVKDFEIEPIGETDALVFGIMERDHGETVLTATFSAHMRKIEGKWRIFSEHGATE